MSRHSFDAVKKIFPSFEMNTFFDVGANIGQTIEQVKVSFPQASIYAFEPVLETFTALSERTKNIEGVRVFHNALSRSDGQILMQVNGSAVTNSVVSGDPVKGANVESVDAISGDAFCSSRSIASVDYLKIDTEGHDLDVLTGFAGFLRSNKVRLVQVEAGLHPGNSRHVPLAHFFSFLEPFGYRLFGIYDQKRERRITVMRRCNAVFMHAELAKMRPAV